MEYIHKSKFVKTKRHPQKYQDKGNGHTLKKEIAWGKNTDTKTNK